jgi:hypothetical protein
MAKGKSRVRVGQKGYVRAGRTRIPVKVLEDRGFIGLGGRQLVRIQHLDPQEDPPLSYEVAAEELELTK